MRDDDVRGSCFASLDVLLAKFGEDVPYAGGLAEGFPFRGRRVPFFSRMKGIHRAAAQAGRAALSILTSAASPYGDRATDEGVLYAYRAGPVEQADNRAPRAGGELGVPLVGTRPVGISPDYDVRVSPRLLEDEDGPMLELLKAFDGAAIELPGRKAWRPDRELLARRFDSSAVRCARASSRP